MFILLNLIEDNAPFLVKVDLIDMVVSFPEGTRLVYSDGAVHVITQTPSAVFELIRKEEKRDATE